MCATAAPASWAWRALSAISCGVTGIFGFIERSPMEPVTDTVSTIFSELINEYLLLDVICGPFEMLSHACPTYVGGSVCLP
jgi:hypothetical protein